MATIRALGPADAAAYDAFVGAHPEATTYHTRAWLGLLEEGFGFRPEVWLAGEGDHIVGALPVARVQTLLGGRRLVSLPFSHRVAPLGDAAVRTALVEHVLLSAAADRCSFAELRAGRLEPPPVGCAVTTDYVNSALALESDADAQMLRLRDNTRQQLRQGLRGDGLAFRSYADAADVARLAGLIGITRRRKGSLTYPRAFFAALEQRLLRPGLARLDLAFAGERCVAALVAFCHGRQAIYAYSASVEDVEVLRRRPLNVLMWRGIAWAIEQGARAFDLGTSLRDQHGLVHFKEGFGAVTEPLQYYVWPESRRGGRGVSQGGVVARLAGGLLKRLPQPVFDRVTPILLKQLG